MKGKRKRSHTSSPWFASNRTANQEGGNMSDKWQLHNEFTTLTALTPKHKFQPFSILSSTLLSWLSTPYSSTNNPQDSQLSQDLIMIDVILNLTTLCLNLFIEKKYSDCPYQSQRDRWLLQLIPYITPFILWCTKLINIVGHFNLST